MAHITIRGKHLYLLGVYRPPAIIQLKCAAWIVVKIIPIHKLYGDKWEGETSTSLSLVSIKNWDTVHNAEDAEAAFNIFEGVLLTALDIAWPHKEKKSKPIHYYDQESAEMKAAYLRTLNEIT
ncbi:hypothetical protein J6590_058515 [Homalodisca vitripennis]|nr:hypothetical protein J6590_058515 [Homalodisca vitripennis]